LETRKFEFDDFLLDARRELWMAMRRAESKRASNIGAGGNRSIAARVFYFFSITSFP
jgi:hypothetical protein